MEANEPQLAVACLTTDFAMQNVLLQMGLKVLSVQGRQIRSVKTFALKCTSCLRITHLVEREFCPACGNHSLVKIQVVVDKAGHVHYRPPRTQKATLRGTRVS